MKKLLLSAESKRVVFRAAACGFTLAVLCAMFPFAASCEALPENIIRLHIVANSNSAEDQAVKLLVRDAVLSESAKYYANAETMQQAVSELCVHLQSIEAAANAVLDENGFSDRAVAQVTDAYFSTRSYGSFALPAGKYRTLRIAIGEGRGKNWWCVVFPALCLPAANDNTDETLSLLPESTRQLVENPQKHRVKFKAVELYEQVKKYFDR